METVIEDVLEEAETAALLLPQLTPDQADGAPQPMTQRRVLGLALPIIGENLLHTAVGAVDTFMVARLGAAAVAGVGTGFEIVFFIIAILSAIDIGATVLVSQAIGAGDRHRANHLAKQAIVWGLVLAAPLSILVYFSAPGIVSLFGTAPDVAEAATIYIQITAATGVTLFLSFVCGAVLRGAGDSKTPLASALLANVINVVLAYALIFGHFGLPALGVAGSAWGATAGRAAGAAVMIAAMAGTRRAISLRGGWGWRPHLSIAHQLFTLGVPAALEQVLTSGALTTLIAVVALLGTASLAAQQIAFTALSLAFLPGLGFSIAATALVGQSIGGRVPSDARKAWSIAQRWAIVWMGVGGGIVFIFGGFLMGLFTNDPEVVAAGVNALRALGLALPFWGVWFVSAGSLRGVGDTRTPLIIGAGSMWLAVLIAWVAVRWFGGGLGWVWLSFVITTAPAALLIWFEFRRRIADYENGRRELPDVSAAPSH